MRGRLETAAVLLACAWIVRSAIRERPKAFGDSGEYMLLAESLFNHGTPDLHGEDLLSLGDAARGGRLVGTYGPVLDRYEAGRDKRAYGMHFWAYPAACLPAKAVLRLLGQNELKAFAITNGLFLAGTLAYVVLGSRLVPRERRTLGALLFASPVLGFVRWPHPEVFSYSLAALALVFHREGRPAAAVLCAALASLQNPPLALLAVGLWATEPLRLASGLALTPAFLPCAFSLWSLGTWSPLARTSCAAANLSGGKALELVFDLNLGLFPYAPGALVLGLVGPLWLAARRRPVRPYVALGAGVVLMALACTATTNWNHGTSGPSRYALWLMPLLFAAVARLTVEIRGWNAWAAAAAIVVQAVITLDRGGFASPVDYLRHSKAARLALERWPGLYNPSPEIFVERTLGREETPRDPVVYRDAEGCRKALVQKRHLPELLASCGAPVRLPDVRALVAERRRYVWFYVDY